MSPHARRGIENGIWLCSNCAGKIDRDPEAYPVALLQEWKRKAERRAEAEQGRRLPEETDANDQLMMVLGGLPKRFIPTAIENTHKAATAVLETLDPRFMVKTEYVNGRTQTALLAKETVRVEANIQGESLAAWTRGLSLLMDHGRSVRLPMSGVRFTGSPLLESIMQEVVGEQASVTLTPNGRAAVLRLRWRGDSAEIQGQLCAGRKTVRFEGALFGGLVSVAYQVSRSGEDALSAGMTFAFHLDRWNGCALDALPYFAKLKSFCESFADESGPILGFDLELEGESLAQSAEPRAVKRDNHIDALCTLLTYTERARKLVAHLGVRITFQWKTSFSAEDHARLADAVHMIEAGRVARGSDGFELKTTLVGIDMDFLRKMRDSQDFHEIQFQEAAQELRLFGKQLTLPPREITLRGVKPRFGKGRATSRGTKAVVNWEPGPGFSWDISYANELDAKGDPAVPKEITD